jgi:membrane protease YdiL (CAAX protease family)
MPWWQLHRLPADSRSYTALVGLVAIAASGLLTMAGAKIGFVGSKVIAEAVIVTCLLWLYPEKTSARSTLKLIAMLTLTGAVIGAAWIACFAPDRPKGGFIDWKAHSFILIAIGYVNAVLTAPLFEEKVLRDLIFTNFSKYLSSMLSSVSVSVLFGIAHSENIFPAFLVSMILCWMMLKYQLNTYQRAVVHGSINLVIMTWYFVN